MPQIKVCIDPQCGQVAHNCDKKETRCRNCGMILVAINEKTYLAKFADEFFQIDHNTDELTSAVLMGYNIPEVDIEPLVQAVMQCLRKADQEMVPFHTPNSAIRRIVGRSENDAVMELVLAELERRGVVEYTTSLHASCGNLYTDLVVTESFFTEYCRSGEQLKLQF